ncbi:histidine kinase [Pedobacter sp. Hv1]|uniref:histidine kinase n=1 Tax=Pedobacter sp. Hv1 TaxID=1740090 RepID=UPI0009E7C387|nr:histidine kinase [Pedobacter sp. Hv1]
MQRTLFFIVALLFLSSCESVMKYKADENRYQIGDDQLWASKDFDDSKWTSERGETGNQVFWVRSTVKLMTIPDGPLGLHIESFGAFEVYWDGVLIGRNGKVIGKNSPEIPGTVTTYLNVPDSLTKIGMHTVALRMSQSYLPQVKRPIGIKLDNYVTLLKRPLIIISFMNLMAGAFLIAAIYYFFLFLSSRNKVYAVLIFGVICLFFFALLMMEYLKFYIDIPYTKFFWRLEIIGWLTFAIALLVPSYFTIQFNFYKKGWLLIALFLTLITVYIVNYHHYDYTAFTYSFVMWLTSVFIVLIAIYKKERGAVIVFFGLFATIIVHQYLGYDFGLFISFTIIVLCMLYLHALRTKAIEEEYQSSLLLSSRLKLELIKKNIQPHFLKNTLTSLIDWVEESPKEGAAFIQALAGEFDIMNSIAEQKLIPIEQEIALCKTHLTVMHYRKEIQYTWDDEGIDKNEEIPPALIHTILENGITHSIPLADGTIGFSLKFRRTEESKVYVFKTKAQNRPNTSGTADGNGFGYVKARLTESYGNNWQFFSEAIADGWETTIKIYNK